MDLEINVITCIVIYLYKVIQDLICDVCSGDVGVEVGTRYHMCHGGWKVGTCCNCYCVYLS